MQATSCAARLFGCGQLSNLMLVSAAALLIAGCSETRMGSRGFSPREYGVPASERVVAMGQPVPRGGGIYRVGNPYQVRGLWYYPADKPGYTAAGMASWYGDDFHGRKTANGEIYNMYALSAAHPTLPLPSYARVTNQRNGRSVVVRINDRGPYHSNRVIDLSKRAALLLGMHSDGLGKVRVNYIGKAPLHGRDDRWLSAQVQQNGRPMSPQQVAMLAPVPQWAAIDPSEQNPVRVALADVLPADPASTQPQNSSYAVASLNNVAPPPQDDERIGAETLQTETAQAVAVAPLALMPVSSPVRPASYAPSKPRALAATASQQVVQVGSFSDAPQAMRYRDALQKFGPATIEMQKFGAATFYQVKLGPFSDPSQAQLALHEAQSQGATGAQLIKM